MTHDDEKRLDAVEEESDEQTAEQIEEGELEDVAGGLRMDPVASKLGKKGRLGGVTVQPRGATVTVNGLTFDKDLEGL